MAEDLVLLEKVQNMMEYGYQALAQFPKSEKFAVVADIKHCMDDVLELAIRAAKKYTKKTTLEDLDIANEKLKVYVRLSFRLKFLPMKKYEVWSGLLVEIGKMIGGWLKSVKVSTRS